MTTTATSCSPWPWDCGTMGLAITLLIPTVLILIIWLGRR